MMVKLLFNMVIHNHRWAKSRFLLQQKERIFHFFIYSTKAWLYHIMYHTNGKNHHVYCICMGHSIIVVHFQEISVPHLNTLSNIPVMNDVFIGMLSSITFTPM